MANAKVEDILKHYPTRQDTLIDALNELSIYAELNREVLLKVARHYNMSPAKAYGIASFYSFLPLTNGGKYVIRICKSISCDMAEKEELVHNIEQLLGIKAGQTTSDGLFTLLETNCMGWCEESPAMLVNDRVYTKLTKDKVVSIINELKNAQKTI